MSKYVYGVPPKVWPSISATGLKWQTCADEW